MRFDLLDITKVDYYNICFTLVLGSINIIWLYRPFKWFDLKNDEFTSFLIA